MTEGDYASGLAQIEDDCDPPDCPVCGSSMEWEECWQCGGEGYSDHDCGEDCCCCADPEPNVVCDICNGVGGYYLCWNRDNHPKEKATP